MEFNNIEDICKSLMEKAKAEQFLKHPVDEIEHEANRFVDAFSSEHRMSAHTISPFRWYFESNQHMFEDGVVELRCNTHAKKEDYPCQFEFVDVSNAKITQKKRS